MNVWHALRRPVAMVKKSTYFGFEPTTHAEKRARVTRVFSSVAVSYDRMNDLMSLGLHRLWKRHTVHAARIQPKERVLDAAGGTGDLARLCHPLVGTGGTVVLCDLNADMLQLARDQLLNAGIVANLHYVQGDLENPPFSTGSFDCVLLAFGLRNIAAPVTALAGLRRVTRPGGRLLVLEFSQPVLRALRPLYRHYCLNWLPRLGRLVANNADGYRYLGESIQAYPPPGTMTTMLKAAGWHAVECFLLAGGIVTLHRAAR